MKKNNSMLIIMWVFVSIIMVVSFVAISLFMNKTDAVSVYIAKNNIRSEVEITSTYFNSNFELQKMTKKEIDEHNASFPHYITRSDEIIGTLTTTYIHKGTILTNAMFSKDGAIEMYNDFNEPVHIELSASENLSLTSHQEGSNVSLIACGQFQPLERIDGYTEYSDEVGIGILTNHALVYKITKNKENLVETIDLVIEKDDFAKIRLAEQSMKLSIIDGVLDFKTLLESDIYKNFFEEAGTMIKDGFEPIVVEYNHIGEDLTKLTTITDDFLFNDTTDDKGYYFSKENTAFKGLNILKSDLQNKGYQFKWRGEGTMCYVYHTNLDGSDGVNYGIYTTSNVETPLYYNKKLQEHGINKVFYEEGYYRIVVRDNANKFISETRFIIEKDDNIDSKYNWIEDATIKISNLNGALKLWQDEKISFSIKGTKEYFKNITDLKDYVEVPYIDEEVVLRNGTPKIVNELKDIKLSSLSFVYDSKKVIGYYHNREIVDLLNATDTDGIVKTYKDLDLLADYSETEYASKKTTYFREECNNLYQKKMIFDDFTNPDNNYTDYQKLIFGFKDCEDIDSQITSLSLLLSDNSKVSIAIELYY